MPDKNPQKKQLPRLTTPRLRLGWPKLITPDYGTKAYPKPDGEFSTRGILQADLPSTQAFLRQLQPIYDAAIEQAEAEFAALKPETRRKLKAVTKNSLFTELLDKVTEEPTGELEFKFTRRASGEYKSGPRAGQRWKAKVPLFDAFGRPITGNLEIWSGSIAKISFAASPYFIPATGAAGLKLILGAVQIIELRHGGALDAKDYGFGTEEDGFSYAEEEAQAEAGVSEGGEGSGAEAETPDF